LFDKKGIVDINLEKSHIYSTRKSTGFVNQWADKVLLTCEM